MSGGSWSGNYDGFWSMASWRTASCDCVVRRVEGTNCSRFHAGLGPDKYWRPVDAAARQLHALTERRVTASSFVLQIVSTRDNPVNSNNDATC